jgi:putative ABC transport system permease protein
MDTAWLDVAYALRTLRRNPPFALAVILTLTIAVGASTAVSGVVHGVLLKPLPMRDQARVVVLRKEQRTGRDTLFPFAVPELRAYADQTRTLETVAGVQYDGAWPAELHDGERFIHVTSTLVSGDFFRVLGVQPVAGRTLNASDDAVHGEKVAVISESLWRREFAADRAVVGRRLRTGGRAITIVGVMPSGLDFPPKVEMWTPTLTALPQAATDRSVAPYNLVGRLRAEASVEQARAELRAFLGRQTYAPGEPREFRGEVHAIESLIVGHVRPALLVLAAAAALLMALATANVANLFLVRGLERRRELAVRAAIGARPVRIARQLGAEGLVLGVFGGAGGIILGEWMLKALVRLGPAELPRLDEIGIDTPVRVVAAALAILSAVVASLVPAAIVTQSRDLLRHLRAGGQSGSTDAGASRGGRVLAVGQVALALVVLVGAGLLARTLERLQSLDMGFAAEEIGTAGLSLPADMKDSRPRLQAFYDRMLGRLDSAAGMRSSTLVLLPPFSGLNGWDASYTVEGQGEAEAAENPALDLQAILPGYFRAMGISIHRGRAIEAGDREGAIPVVVVGEALARQAWPGQDPVGRRIKLGTASSERPWLSVVGVAADVRYRELTSPRPVVYVPWSQATGLPPLTLLITRGATRASLPLADLNRIVREGEPAASVTEGASMRQLIAASLTKPRFNAVVLGAIALIALVVAAVGIYGVMASLVRQRVREIGIRLALGARPQDVHRMVLSRGLALAGFGVGAGLAVALPTARLLGAVLYEVSPSDPLAVAAACGILAVVASVASYLPARAATRLDPIVVLRSD